MNFSARRGPRRGLGVVQLLGVALGVSLGVALPGVALGVALAWEVLPWWGVVWAWSLGWPGRGLEVGSSFQQGLEVGSSFQQGKVLYGGENNLVSKFSQPAPSTNVSSSSSRPSSSYNNLM